MPQPYVDRLESVRQERDSVLCVGIDPRVERMPSSLRALGIEEMLFTFGRDVFEQTRAHAACWKPNIAFFEAHGLEGLRAYARVVAHIRSEGGLVIGDIKRSDLGSTAIAYAKAHLGAGAPFEVDAVTLNPYLGRDGLAPFIDAAAANGKGLYVLVRTSNPGAADLQEHASGDLPHLFDRVADLLTELGAPHVSEATGLSLVGAVVGATSPVAGARIRERMPHAPFLVPGFGAQGAGAEDVAPCFRADGSGAVVNASRSITYPPDDDWHAAVARAAARAREEIHAATAPA